MGQVSHILDIDFKSLYSKNKAPEGALELSGLAGAVGPQEGGGVRPREAAPDQTNTISIRRKSSLAGLPGHVITCRLSPPGHPMTRDPKAKEPDAWKRWLIQGWKLFDRTWSGWTLAWWLFSLGVVYAATQFSNLFGVGFLVFISAAAFAAHIAVFDALAAGKRGTTAWVSAAWGDLTSHGSVYARLGAKRALIALAAVIVFALFIGGIMAMMPDKPDEAPKVLEQPLWKSWTVWAWVWLIPAGWQKVGPLGWGHWLMRREGADLETAERLAQMAIGLNHRSYLIVIGVLMVGAMALMFIFPPLLPVWDVYAAAVCWCIWDDIFGDGDGLKEMEPKRVAISSRRLSGA